MFVTLSHQLLSFALFFCTTLVQSHKHLRGTSIDGCLASAVTTSATTTFKYVQIWSLDTWESCSGGHSLTARSQVSIGCRITKRAFVCRNWTMRHRPYRIGAAAERGDDCSSSRCSFDQSAAMDPFIWLRATRDGGWVTVEHGWTLSLNQRGDRRHWFECVNFNYRSNLGQLKRYRSECRFFKCCSLSEIVQM